MNWIGRWRWSDGVDNGTQEKRVLNYLGRLYYLRTQNLLSAPYTYLVYHEVAPYFDLHVFISEAPSSGVHSFLRFPFSFPWFHQ